MSAYRENTTQFKDGKILAECLKTHFKTVLVHATAQQLEGYHGDKRAQRAEIIIPRSAIGCASNDIGFKLQPDGTYSAIISDFDSHTYGATFLKKLELSYTETFYKAKAAKIGARLVSRKSANGETVLQFVHN